MDNTFGITRAEQLLRQRQADYELLGPEIDAMILKHGVEDFRAKALERMNAWNASQDNEGYDAQWNDLPASLKRQAS